MLWGAASHVTNNVKINQLDKGSTEGRMVFQCGKWEEAEFQPNFTTLHNKWNMRQTLPPQT